MTGVEITLETKQAQTYLTIVDHKTNVHTHCSAPETRECQQKPTFQEVPADHLEHGFVDFRVGDGVEQLTLFGIGEDEATELVPVDVAALQQHLGPKMVDDAAVGDAVPLHHWPTQTQSREKEQRCLTGVCCFVLLLRRSKVRKYCSMLQFWHVVQCYCDVM